MSKSYSDKLKGSKFKCNYSQFFRGGCKACFEVHNGYCDYHKVMNFRPLEKRNRCPICLYKNERSRCEVCIERNG